ncbi:hypothetical protein CQW29_11045 [Pantoea coffeiphila]|uniref:Uncharacterized protein n=1 Tax=Pantoea coffeiphila TaxID=1465635 RepID=A0A2S9ICR5_9GAMM|nr:hypothetical protein CQW29_11045 [Pantoea coffeiphila]
MNYTFAQQKKKAFSIQILVMVANVNTTPAIADWSIDSSLMKGAASIAAIASLSRKMLKIMIGLFLKEFNQKNNLTNTAIFGVIRSLK